MAIDCERGIEVQQYLWGSAIPLQIHLHNSEMTTLPPPSPALILAPRIGYLNLLVPQIKPFFSGSLPPGVDTVWFEYKGLPFKWYIPTEVLFDLLCAEPEKPWNLTVHFRGYPGNILTPCKGEDSVKWGFINGLKEAAYIINGNCKNIINISQSDQAELWRSVLNGQLEVYLCISSKLKLNVIGDDCSMKLTSSMTRSCQGSNDLDAAGATRIDRVPVWLYVRTIDQDIDDLEGNTPTVDNWEKVSCINRLVEVHSKGKCFTLYDALKSLLPELLKEESTIDASTCGEQQQSSDGGGNSLGSPEETGSERAVLLPDGTEIKLVRIQGIEPQLDIPFRWVKSSLLIALC